MKRLVILAVAASAALLAVADNHLNLIQNAGFEEVDDYTVALTSWLWQMRDSGCDIGGGPIVSLPRAWAFQCNGGKIQIVEGESGKEVHTGKRALFLGGDEKGVSVYQEGSGKPGKRYHFSFYARGTGQVYARAYESAGNKMIGVPVIQTYTIAASWRKYEGVYECNPAADVFGFVIGINPHTEAFFDDLTLWPE